MKQHFATRPGQLIIARDNPPGTSFPSVRKLIHFPAFIGRYRQLRVPGNWQVVTDVESFALGLQLPRP